MLTALRPGLASFFRYQGTLTAEGAAATAAAALCRPHTYRLGGGTRVLRGCLVSHRDNWHAFVQSSVSFVFRYTLVRHAVRPIGSNPNAREAFVQNIELHANAEILSVSCVEPLCHGRTTKVA